LALELINILDENISRESCSATIRYKCLDSERYTVANALIGGFSLLGVWTPPASYPYSWNLRVKDVKVKPVGEVFGSPGYVYLDVTYETPKPEEQENNGADPEDLFTVSVSVSCEGVALPKGDFKWADNNEPLTDEDIAIQKWLPCIEVSLKCGRMVKLKTSTCASLAGKINSATFKIPNDDSFGVGQVLFLTMNGEQKKTSEGFDYASRDLKFMIRPDGWNKLWRPATGYVGGGAPGAWVATTPPIYESASFTNLFTG